MLHNAIAARGIINSRACISDIALSLISGGEQGDQVNHATIYHHSLDCLLPSLLRDWWDRCRRKRALLVPTMRLFYRRRVREDLWCTLPMRWGFRSPTVCTPPARYTKGPLPGPLRYTFGYHAPTDTLGTLAGSSSTENALTGARVGTAASFGGALFY